MSTTGKFLELLDDYVADESSSTERGELLHMVKSGEYQELLEQHITATFNSNHLEGPVLSTRQQEEILQNIFAEARLAAPVIAMGPRKRYTWRWAAAAAIFVAVGVGIFWPHPSTKQVAIATQGSSTEENRVVPGGYKATLTLGDGSVVALDKANALPGQGNVQVTNNGQELIYTGTQDNNNIVYNKLSTPRGGQYRIVLPDGSKVWLNAASTLRFPIAFAGDERLVLLTGEAYFEVNSHPVLNGRQQKAPFIVSVNGAKVTVLGTHFNVMAYGDEQAMKATLLEGAVKIEHGQAGSVLKPGEQAVLRQVQDGNEIKVAKANTAAVTAWKNGYFDFDGADIPTVMRQVARWYDLEVVYEKGLPPAKQFDGRMSRETTIADLVKILETNGIHVRVEARTRKIVVLS